MYHRSECINIAIENMCACFMCVFACTYVHALRCETRSTLCVCVCGTFVEYNISILHCTVCCVLYECVQRMFLSADARACFNVCVCVFVVCTFVSSVSVFRYVSFRFAYATGARCLGPALDCRHDIAIIFVAPEALEAFRR